jgi:transposase-like protein
MRRQHTPKQIERILARRERRGLTWSALAEEAGVSVSTLLAWSRRRAKVQDSGSTFVEVEVPRERGHETSAVEVVLPGGRRIVVAVGFDPEHLRRVVRALESC